jgi:hypothetical protein
VGSEKMDGIDVMDSMDVHGHARMFEKQKCVKGEKVGKSDRSDE